MKSICLVIFCFVSLVCAFNPEFILYTETSFAGNSFTFRNKEADLSDLGSWIIDNCKSKCLQGVWFFYDLPNFEGPSELYIWMENGDPYCYNSVPARYGSVRYLGSAESTAQSISFYADSFYNGTEIVVTEDGIASLPLAPLSIFSTGFSNWTLFSEENFEGTALCYTSTRDYHMVPNLDESISITRSVVKDCRTERVHKYINANELTV